MKFSLLKGATELASRALSGRLNFTARRHTFNKDFLLAGGEVLAAEERDRAGGALPLGGCYAPRHRPTVGSWGGVCPQFRVTPVCVSQGVRFSLLKGATELAAGAPGEAALAPTHFVYRQVWSASAPSAAPAAVIHYYSR